ncbi:hypothetical protein [uncultured Roseobacter sp.]|uniref:hypothetical protein n=1 Tax=uncultured Roseobacter sp. TaxID=114847 RepID=UPI0026049806|nr:hypothetical protein [uncultured Roseobacter sp.]
MSDKATSASAEKNEQMAKAAADNVDALQFNPCIGVETVVLDLQRRVAALEAKVG